MLSLFKYFRCSLRHSASSPLVSAARTSLPFLFSPTLALSSPPSLLSYKTVWHIWHELSSFSSFTTRQQWVPRHSFFPGNDAADELARRNALLVPSAIPCSLSPIISRIHYPLVSDWWRTVSSKFFDTRVFRCRLKNVYLLVTLAVSSLVFAATDTAYC